MIFVRIACLRTAWLTLAGLLCLNAHAQASSVQTNAVFTQENAMTTSTIRDFQHPVSGERVTLTEVGSQVIRTVNGQSQPVSAEAYAERLRAEAEAQAQQFRGEDFYSPMMLAQYRLELMADGGSVATAQKLWQESGLPLRLWEELDEMAKGPLALLLGMGAMPLDGGANFNPSVFMSEMAYSGSIRMSEDGQAFEVERNGERQTIPIPKDSLLFHPPAELREHFNRIYRARMNAYISGPAFTLPTSAALYDDTARQLQAEGYLPVLPRRADGRPALPAELEPYRTELTADERPVLRLRPVPVAAGETLSPWASRLRGVPYRLRGEPWPVNRAGEPLSFLAQLNLTELNADGHLADLPRTGLLQFFFGPQGIDEGHVIYREQVLENAAALEKLELTAPAPYPDEWLNDMLTEGEWGWQSVADTDIPSGIAMNNRHFPQRHPDLPQDTWERYVNEWFPSGSRLGGHAMLINDYWPEDEDWVNLFQFDGDFLDMGGWIAFRIPAAALEQRDFSQAVVVGDAF